jgi:hypothetical protein
VASAALYTDLGHGAPLRPPGGIPVQVPASVLS